MTRNRVTTAKRFLEGDFVEVRQKEEGLRGAWFAAVIVGVLPGKRIVEYDELLAHEGSTTKLRETVNVSVVFDGQTTTSLKYAARTAKPMIRPRPIPLSHPTPFSWTEGTWVDCWCEDAWWEGFLNENVTNVEFEDTESLVILTPRTEVAVRFPGEYDMLKVQLKNMRLMQEYHENGTWSRCEKVAPQFIGSSEKEKGKAIEARCPVMITETTDEGVDWFYAQKGLNF